MEKTILTKSLILPDVKLIHTQNHGNFHWKVPLGGIERHWNQSWPSYSLSLMEVGIHATKIQCVHSYPDWQHKWGPGDHVRDGSLAPEFCTAEETETKKDCWQRRDYVVLWERSWVRHIHTEMISVLQTECWGLISGKQTFAIDQ